MATIHTQVVLAAVTALPRDEVVNNFVFETVNTPWTAGEQTAIENALIDFYNTDEPTHILGVHHFLAGTISRAASAAQFRHYDVSAHLNGSAAGSPVGLSNWTLGAEQAGGKDWPEQTALALSFHAAYASDVEFAPGARPRSRDRGRVFLGPLNDLGYAQDTTTKRVKPTTAMTDVWKAAGGRLLAAGIAWSVWSRKAAITKPVTAGWVDDRFDSQRRRAEDASTRYTF